MEKELRSVRKCLSILKGKKTIINSEQIESISPEEYGETPHDFLHVDLKEHPPFRIYFEDWREMEDAIRRIANGMDHEARFIKI